MKSTLTFASMLLPIVLCRSILLVGSTTTLLADGTISVDCSSNQGAFPYYNHYVSTIRSATGSTDDQLMKNVGVHLERTFYDMGIVCTSEGTYEWHALATGAEGPADTKYWGSDNLLDNIIAQGAQPWIDLVGIPSWLRDGTTGLPTNWTKYETMIRDILRHLKSRYPQMVYVGLLNEWSNYDGCIHHSLSSYETLYQHTANALAAVNATLSGVPLLKIGGPNESNDEYTLNLFLSWCHDNSIPIGFVSYHLYRDNISDITSTVNTVQRYMKNYGYGNLPQLIGECGLHNSASTTYTASDLAKQAAFEAASWRAYMDTGLGEQVKPMIFAENGYDGLHNLSVLVPDEADRKEGQVFPRYNGYKMMSMMRSHRISSTSNNNGIYSIASSDSTGVAVLFINYSSSAQNAYINVNNLPSAFHSENIHYDRYLVDGTHSNYAYSQSNQGLQKVEDSSLSSGSSKSLTINMAAYATSLIVLTP